MKPTYDAFIVKELSSGAEAPRNLWRKVGAAWNHRDGLGISIQLDLLPVPFDGRLVLRETIEEPAQGGDDEENPWGDAFSDEHDLPF